MGDGTSLPAKLYFRIGEVAGLVGVEPHVLRYWEREFRSIRPSKSAKGQRVYSRRDVENLLRVRDLLYGQGFTIAGARRRLREKGSEASGEQSEAATGAEEAFAPTSEALSEPSAPRLSPEQPVGARAPESAESAPSASSASSFRAHPEASASLGGHPSNGNRPGDSSRMRGQLEDLKSEIEAFLQELET
jgi:DNA-binding transcriptional MerR regulator